MMTKSLSDFFHGTFEWKNLRVKWHDPTKTLIFNSNWSIPFHPETCGLNVNHCNCELRQAAKAMNVVKNLKPRFVIYLVMNPIRFITIQERSTKNNESQKSIVSEYYRTIKKFHKKMLNYFTSSHVHWRILKEDVIGSLLQLTNSQCTLALPRTGSVLASETPCPRFFAIATWPLVDGFSFLFVDWNMQHGLSFRMCGRSNFGCPVSRKVSQISTMSSNRSNSPTWKPPNP